MARKPDRNVGFKPLYAQVKDQLIRRLVDGTWPPGSALPNEFDLAAEMKVSQGTVRKALDSMTAENLLVRRQGRGTFVAELEESRILFQFFHLKPDTGSISFPQSTVLACARSEPTADETRQLGLKRGSDVWRLERSRSMNGAAVIIETIAVPADRFDGFGEIEAIPNNVYELYSKHWGITVAQADEQLKAVPASSEDARQLCCEPDAPLLLITRLARDLEGRPVELRRSRCLTRSIHYEVRLR